MVGNLRGRVIDHSLFRFNWRDGILVQEVVFRRTEESIVISKQTDDSIMGVHLDNLVGLDLRVLTLEVEDHKIAPAVS